MQKEKQENALSLKKKVCKGFLERKVMLCRLKLFSTERSEKIFIQFGSRFILITEKF